MKRLSITLLALAALSLSAVEYTWTNSAGGDWTDPANWASASGSYPELPGDVANITNMPALTISLPNGAVTCGVIQASELLQYVTMRGAGSDTSRIVLTNTPGEARIVVAQDSSRYGLLFENCTVEFTHPALLETGNAQASLEFKNGGWWAGDTTVTARHNGFNQYFRLYGVPSPEFTGELVAAKKQVFMRFSASLTNARLVRVKANVTLQVRQTTTMFPVLLEDGGEYRIVSGASTHSGDLTVQGNVSIEADAILTLSGDVNGTGTVAMSGSSSAALFTGSITPGASVGILGFNENAGTLALGEGGSNVLLNIQVPGSGGVPGVDHDQLTIANLDTPLDLGNIDVAFSGATANSITNWFLVGNAIDLATDFASVDYGGAAVGYLVKEENYSGTDDRVGVVIVPEPCAGLAGLFALLWAARRR